MADREVSKSPSQRVFDMRERYIRVFQPYRDARDAEKAFLAGDRYDDDHGDYNKDRRLVQIRGQETQDTIRHVVAKCTERPRSVEARPIDPDTDPHNAEAAIALLEWELSNPWKGFESNYEQALQAARETRIGIVWADYHKDCGPFGEILTSYEDANFYSWDPCYDPHHPLCNLLIREYRMDVDEARDLYDADWLEPDRYVYAGGKFHTGAPLIRGADGVRLGSTFSADDDKVTLWQAWWKNDKKFGKKRQKEELPEPEKYMSCMGGCGLRTSTVEMGGVQELAPLLMAAGLPLEVMPEYLPRGCPQCSGDLMRIDVAAEDKTLAYTKGRRLQIVAPFCVDPDGKGVYDGKWPIPSCRSFPALFITSYIDPGKPMGTSDTKLMWDQQLALDQLRTLGVQRIFEHRNYWEIPTEGVVDAHQRRWMPRDDDMGMIYRDASAEFQGQVQLHQGTGLDPNFMNIFTVQQNALTQYRGVTDLGLSQDSSKDIAASTVAQLNQMGEIPTAHFLRRVHQELGKFYGVYWDMIRATYTPERLARLRMNDVDVVMGVQGDDMPNFDFIISDTPNFTGQEKAKVDALKLLEGVAPEKVELYAETLNLPRSTVRKFGEAAQAQMQREMAMGMMAGGPPPGQGAPADEGAGGGLEPLPVG